MMMKDDNDTILHPKIHIKNHFLSSAKSFGEILYGKGENRKHKTRDFLEMIVFAVNLKITL
jgi:hypothetical protein